MPNPLSTSSRRTVARNRLYDVTRPPALSTAENQFGSLEPYERSRQETLWDIVKDATGSSGMADAAQFLDVGGYAIDRMDEGDYAGAAAAVMPVPGAGRLTKVGRKATGVAKKLVEDAFLGRHPTTNPKTIAAKTRASGGYSVNVPTGEIPEEGLMVGKYANDDPRNMVIEGRPVRSTDIEAHAKTNEQALKKPEHYLGTWTDDGKTYLDVSQRFPGGQVRQATKAGEKTGQLAGFDVGNMESFPIGNWKEFVDSPDFAARLDEMSQRGRQYLDQFPSKEWWDMHGTGFERVYGPENMRQVAGFTAVTAPNSQLRPNVQTMSEYMRRHIKGEPIVQPDWRVPETAMSRTPGTQIGMEKDRAANLGRAAKGNLEEISGNKVREEALAMTGDPNAVPLDRHHIRLSENPAEGVYAGTQEGQLPKDTKSSSPYYHLKGAIGRAAERAGMNVRDYSANVWTGIRETIRGTGELYGTKYRRSAIQGESKGYADHFEDLLKEKADHLGISVPELEQKLRAGDADLLSFVLAVPLGASLLGLGFGEEPTAERSPGA
jgi:hypothetical protein